VYDHHIFILNGRMFIFPTFFYKLNFKETPIFHGEHEERGTKVLFGPFNMGF
jgi:hypothetical protein